MHDGKTDLVTRAASDIEAESFRLLKAKGAAVIGIDRTEEDMKVMVRPGMQ
jgi:NADP-dependent 3-hydroxy acid dehydrogenase YdfG